MKTYSNSELEYLLDNPETSEQNLDEDLLIEQPDGTKACLNWELRNGGFQLTKPNYEKPLNEMTDKELLESAYKELKKYK
jgi:phosphatidate phosphatase PAH1